MSGDWSVTDRVKHIGHNILKSSSRLPRRLQDIEVARGFVYSTCKFLMTMLLRVVNKVSHFSHCFASVEEP